MAGEQVPPYVPAHFFIYYAQPIYHATINPNPLYRRVKSAQFVIFPDQGKAGLVRWCEKLFEASNESDEELRSMSVGDLVQFYVPKELDVTFRCENSGWEEVPGPTFVIV